MSDPGEIHLVSFDVRIHFIASGSNDAIKSQMRAEIKKALKRRCYDFEFRGETVQVRGEGLEARKK